MAFFEQLGKKISSAGQGVAQQTKNFADVSKLNSAISEKERQVAQLYTQIGSQYYDRHKDDASSEFADLSNAITKLIAEIEQCRENIKIIKGVIKCPNCGAEIPSGTLFCTSCGTRIVQAAQPSQQVAPQPNVQQPYVQQPVPPAAPQQRICPNCGNAVADGNLFCNNCGNKMEN